MTSAQLSLFSSPSCSAPSEAHELIYLDASGARTSDQSQARSVRVRLRLTGEHEDQPLTTGPLTLAECQAWELPCKLYHCRYRLPDDVEHRTRHALEPDEDHLDNPIEEYEGPRTKHGAYYSDAEIGPGHWCALAVADMGGLKLEELGSLLGFGTKQAVAQELLEGPIASFYDALKNCDEDWEDLMAGREVRRAVKPVNDDLSAKDAQRAVVPGENKTCPACGVTVPKVSRVCDCGAAFNNRWVPTIRRRKRGPGWDGVTHIRVPEHLADRVDPKLLKSIGGDQSIDPKFSDIRQMIARRKAA